MKIQSKSNNLSPLVIEDDGYFLVKDYYQMAFPPLRANFEYGCRSYDGKSGTTIMAYQDNYSTDTYRDDYLYKWTWPWPGDDVTPSSYSLYFKDEESMKMSQSSKWNSFNNYLIYNSTNANNLIVTDIPAYEGISSIDSSQYVKTFAEFYPGFANGEIFIEGELIPDLSGRDSAWFYEEGQTATITLTVTDTKSKRAYVWYAGEWINGGTYYTGYQYTKENVGPGPFYFKIPLSKFKRRDENTYVDLSNRSDWQNPTIPPSFTPPSDLSDYEWPEYDETSGLTRTGAFEPENIIGIQLDAWPNTNQEGSFQVKLRIKNLRFKEATNNGVYYTEDSWLYNDPIGLTISNDGYTFPLDDKFGEGYSLNINVSTSSALRYLYTENRWESRTSYPFAMYVKAKIYDPNFLDPPFYSSVPRFTLMSLSGPFTGYPFCWDAAIEIVGGYPSIAIRQPNYDYWNSPLVYASNGAVTIDTTDVAIMDPVPDNGLYGENFRLKANTEYQFLVNFETPDTTLDENDIERAGIKLYVIDEDGYHLVGWSQWQNQYVDYMGTNPSSYYLDHRGISSQVIIGADGFYGSITNIAQASIPEARLYQTSLTEEEISGIVAGNPRTDAAASKLAQAWFLPDADPDWKQAANPKKPNAIYPSVDKNPKDALKLGIAAPKLWTEVWDADSKLSLGKLSGYTVLNVGNETTIKYDFDRDRTYEGRYLNPMTLYQLIVQPSGAITDSVKLKQLYFKQQQKVLCYQTISLEELKEFELDYTFSLPDLTNLYWRVSLPEGTVSSNNNVIRVKVYDTTDSEAGIYDSETFSLTSNSSVYYDEIDLSQVIKFSGEELDLENIIKVSIEQTSGSESLNLERLDFRIARYTFVSEPKIVTSTETLELNFKYLSVPEEKGFYLNVIAENLSSNTISWYLRIDDYLSAGAGYYNRFDLEDHNVPPGMFKETVQLDGLHSNRNAYNPGRFMDITKLTRIIASAESTIKYHVMNILQGFQFKVANAKAWHFGDTPAASGFKTVLSTDTLTANSVYGVLPYTESPIGASSVINLSSSYSQQLTSDPFNNIALRYVKKFEARGLEPGEYQIYLWNEWLNEYGNWSRTLRRTYTINGTVIEDLNYVGKLHQWMTERKLESKDKEPYYTTDTPYDLYGYSLGNPNSANVTVSSNGTLTLTVSNADSVWGTELVALMMNPLDNLNDSNRYFIIRRNQFNDTFTVAAMLPEFDSVAIGETKITEIPFYSQIRNASVYNDYKNSSAQLEHILGKGQIEHLAFIVMSDFNDENAILSYSTLSNGSSTIPIQVRWGQWNYARQLNSAIRDMNLLRGEIDKFNIRRNVPRGIFIQVNVPVNQAAGTYTGSFTITINGNSFTKNYSVKVLPLTLPEPNKGIGLYLFDNPYSVWLGRADQAYDGYTKVRSKEIENHVNQGMNTLAVPSVTPGPDNYYVAPSGSTSYATFYDKFLAEMADYKTAGMGNLPYFLYQQWTSFVTTLRFTYEVPTYYIACQSPFYPTMNTVWAKFPATMLGANNTFSRSTVHEYYRTQLGITDPTDTLKFTDTETGNTVLRFRGYKIWCSINGVSYLPIEYQTGSETGTGNNEKSDTMHLPSSYTPANGDIVWMYYDMSNYDWIRNGDGTPGANSYIDFSQQRKWLLNRMTDEAKVACEYFRTNIVDPMLANTSKYPIIPYVALVDEIEVQTQNGVYYPTPACDLVRVSSDAIHAILPEVKTVAACGGDMGGVNNFLAAFNGYIDVAQCNSGNEGSGAWTTPEVLSLLLENNITPWIYNAKPLRWCAGFYLWAHEFENFTHFSSNGWGSLPYNYFSGVADYQTWPTELDSNGNVYNRPDDIGTGFADFAEGISDFRWCMWLDQQVLNGITGASALKTEVLSYIPVDLGTMLSNGNAPDYEYMNNLRKKITDFAKQINNIT